MSEEDKKLATIHIYYESIKEGIEKTTIYKIISRSIKMSDRWVADTVRLWKSEKRLKESKRGKFPKVDSPMEDPQFCEDLTTFVEENSHRPGQKNLTLEDIRDWVYEYLEADQEEEKYSLQAIDNWLHKLGFSRKDATKKVNLL